ncbi:MAG TPA: aldehyde ferredoxin oxidoreductase N-terminal domain-containing protein, partial [Thermodesulfobacteriota bacterium]|nr:aldehyde ferredoxin oxidoreductase N-terminal domain-containing protein [Thermodesulfobacteriota bacterium]
IKPIPLEVRRKFIGGRGLDAYLLYNHTKQGCDPYGPDNALIVSGGLLTATCASATARTHVMARRLPGCWVPVTWEDFLRRIAAFANWYALFFTTASPIQ